MKRTIEEEKRIMLEMMRKLNPDAIKEELTPDVVPETPSEMKEGNAFSGNEQDELSNNQKYHDTLKDIANSGYDQGDDFIEEGEPLNDAIVNYIDALEAKGLSREEIHQNLMSVVEAAIEGDKNMQQDKKSDKPDHFEDLASIIRPEIPKQKTNELKEGNAFVGAAKKAKEEGKDSFELDGKTYKVTVSKSEK
jgi:hypothetical protein